MRAEIQEQLGEHFKDVKRGSGNLKLHISE